MSTRTTLWRCWAPGWTHGIVDRGDLLRGQGGHVRMSCVYYDARALGSAVKFLVDGVAGSSWSETSSTPGHCSHGGRIAVTARKASWAAVFNVTRRHLPTLQPRSILDVGADVGETTEIFALRYPDARVDAFEPVPTAYRLLHERMRSFRRVRCHEVALSDRADIVSMDVPDNSRLARIVPPSEAGREMLEVRSITGDAFCSDERIPVVDILKIDTEGHDLAVLQGFEGMLTRQSISLIDVEVGVAPDNDRHVALGTVQRYLDDLGYLPFWLHEPTMDLYFTGRPTCGD